MMKSNSMIWREERNKSDSTYYSLFTLPSRENLLQKYRQQHKQKFKENNKSVGLEAGKNQVWREPVEECSGEEKKNDGFTFFYHLLMNILGLSWTSGLFSTAGVTAPCHLDAG